MKRYTTPDERVATDANAIADDRTDTKQTVPSTWGPNV